MPTETRYPSGHGHAWRGDWNERLAARLHSLGFDSLSHLAKDNPGATIQELVSILGAGDFAIIQVEWALMQEAENSGTVRQCAIDLLVRLLRSPENGWPAAIGREEQAEVCGLLVSWLGLLPDRYRPHGQQVVVSFLRDADIPAHWRPVSADDEHIRKHMSSQWPTEY